MTTEQRPHAGEIIPPECPAAHDTVMDWLKYLQANDPVHLDEDGRFILTRYKDVHAVLKGSDVWSSEHVLTTTDTPVSDARWIVYKDDPEHMDWRKLFARGFTPASIAELEPKFRAHAVALTDELEPGEPFDAVKLGAEYTKRCWVDLCGLTDHGGTARLQAWLPVVAGFTKPRERRPPMTRAPEGPSHFESPPEAFFGGFADMKAFFSTRIAEHRDHDPAYCKEEEGLVPFLRAIVASCKDSEENLDIVLRNDFPPMIAGGLSTAAHFYPNALDVLLDNPHVWSMVRDDRSLIALNKSSEVVEEFARLKSNHPGLNKIPLEDVEIDGVTIPAGSFVQCYYIAADHDPEEFEDPEEFKLRGITRHFAWGLGTHTCPGQAYGRETLKILLSELMDRFETIGRAPEHSDWTWQGGYYTMDQLLVVGHAASEAASNGHTPVGVGSSSALSREPEPIL